jgi:ABC-type oligopeptide transport system ATPase subunit
VSFTIEAGRSLGIVGESGSGKSTLARLVMALDKPTAGSVTMLGRDLHTLDPQAAARGAARLPDGVPGPVWLAGPAPDRGAHRHRTAGRARRHTQIVPRRPAQAATEVLASVGLRASDLDKYPHEFSGGQRQRIAIARALITRPRLIVADEPVSALDVSVQAQVLNLMQDLQAEFGVTYCSSATTWPWCTTCATRWPCCGRAASSSKARPSGCSDAAEHPYTRALLDAVPQAQPGRHARNRRRQSALSNEQILLAQSEPSRG